MKASTGIFKTLHKLILIRTLFLAVGLLSFCSCQKNHRPSFIVLAADRFSFNSFSCNDERGSNSGLSVLCQESIRYTNAYTTSTQSAAALASLLTGQYPYKHDLHRSTDRLNASLPTVSEAFKKSGYRTAFWSASPTVLKKTGLARGFDLFEDSSFLNQPSYTSLLAEQIKQFEAWVTESSDPFFAVIYNSDLESLREGENTVSRFELFEEKLSGFINTLKAQDLWEKNYVIVVGLQGHSEYNRPNETPYSNLHSENINTAFFIKPPRQKGDEGVNIKIDITSTLADFGLSLMKYINPEHENTADALFPVWDYSDLWFKSRLDKLDEPAKSSRKITIEAANTWTPQHELRFAFVEGNYISIEDEKNTLFNKLTDGLETIDLSKSLPDLDAEFEKSFSQLRNLTKAAKWVNYQPVEYKWTELNRRYWLQSNEREKLFENERSRLAKEKSSHPLSTLLIYYLNTKKEKDAVYEEARRISYNLALENIWGLWNAGRLWPQPAVTTENQ